VQAGEIVWPAPQKIAIGSLANFGYEGTVLLPVPLTVQKDFAPKLLASELEIALDASWLVCQKECIPQEGRFVVRVPLRGSTALHAADFAAAQAAAPVAFKGSAKVQVDAQGLLLTVQGLPAAWRGRALNAFVETPELIETAASPASSDAVSNASANGAWPAPRAQMWNADTWSARLPLWAYRNSTPTTLPVVLALEGPSLRTVAPIKGTWPAAAPPASVSPALQAALESNAAKPVDSDTLGTFAWALLAAVLGGLILNLMPCVFPVLAIKLLHLSAHSEASRNAQRAQGLAYGAGVVLSFMALGALLLALRAGGEQLGWGFQLQSPAVVATLSVLFTLLGLNLMGLLQVGHVLPSRWATLRLSHPMGDAFLSGVLAVAIASPCTAPFMGASLGLALTLPSAHALALFAALGVGLALPYVAASWLPTIARWLPRPGAWMDTLRRVLAFPMWATVVWLLWVLGHLSGVDAAASLLALLLALALIVWSLSLSGGARLWIATISIAIGALLTWAIGQNVLHNEPTSAAQGTATDSAASGNWQAWAPGRVQAELAAGRPVFVDFTAAWCITCQLNKKTTLSNPDVLADFAAKRVTLLRADWTRRDPAITQALTQLGRSGVPVYVLYRAGKAPLVLSEIISAKDVRTALETL
jgi:thiol:disulfide interchange protein DsbD